MNKSELITHIRTLQREVDCLMDIVIAMEEKQPEQPVQIRRNDDDGWLTVAQVCKELRISDSTFYEWLNAGLLPPGLEFGPRSKRWRMSDIEDWKNARQKPDNGVVEIPKKRRGRPSRIRKIKEYCYV